MGNFAMVLICLGSGKIILGNFWVFVIAWEDSFKHAVLSLLLPFYPIFYAKTRWYNCRKAGLTWIGGIGVFISGVLVGTSA